MVEKFIALVKILSWLRSIVLPGDPNNTAATLILGCASRRIGFSLQWTRKTTNSAWSTRNTSCHFANVFFLSLLQSPYQDSMQHSVSRISLRIYFSANPCSGALRQRACLTSSIQPPHAPGDREPCGKQILLFPFHRIIKPELNTGNILWHRFITRIRLAGVLTALVQSAPAARQLVAASCISPFHLPN